MTITSLIQSKNQNADDYGRRVDELLAKQVDLCLRLAKILAIPFSSIGSSEYKPNDSDLEI